MEWKEQTHVTRRIIPRIPFGVACYMLPGQPPAWQKSLGQGPLGHVSHAWLDGLLRPTAKPESNLLRAELSHFSQLCLREFPAFSRNFVTCPQSLHLYSNIGTAVVSFSQINPSRQDRAPANPVRAARCRSYRTYCNAQEDHLQHDRPKKPDRSVNWNLVVRAGTPQRMPQPEG